MSYEEAEEFIQEVISPGEVMDVFDVMKKYRGKTLKEALDDDYFFHSSIAEIMRGSDPEIRK